MTRKLTLASLGGIFLFCFFGCSSQTADGVVLDWESKGWTSVSVHGKIGPITRHGKLSSPKAQAVEASWVEGGKRKTKVYSQTSHFYLVLRFFKEDGDQFAVVMKKRK